MMVLVRVIETLQVQFMLIIIIFRQFTGKQTCAEDWIPNLEWLTGKVIVNRHPL